ncbi:MAG: mechanosensitive ion channel family protein [Desulfobulbaceae bacterium]|nr:mechanosensitive ion channel family protein [Desulfobulbaceae bacterium]
MKLHLTLQIGLSVLVTALYILTISITNTLINKYGARQNFLKKRILYLKKTVAASFFVLFLVILSLVWGFDFRGVLFFASSFFAVVGIALFASWSILSNITTGIIIFFSFPYRIGDQIRVIDGENSVTGKIIDMTLFHIQIRDDNKHVIAYPNNLIIQRPVVQMTPSCHSS